MANRLGAAAQWAFGIFFGIVFVGGAIGMVSLLWERAPGLVLFFLVLFLVGVIAAHRAGR